MYLCMYIEKVVMSCNVTLAWPLGQLLNCFNSGAGSIPTYYCLKFILCVCTMLAIIIDQPIMYIRDVFTSNIDLLCVFVGIGSYHSRYGRYTRPCWTQSC